MSPKPKASRVRKNPLATRLDDKMVKNNYHVTNIICCITSLMCGEKRSNNAIIDM